MSTSRRSDCILLFALATLALVVMLAGCDVPPAPYVPKADVPPAIVYCNDVTGHKAGAEPYVRGGTCCCTPSAALMKKLQADGFCAGMSAEDLTTMYTIAKCYLANEKDHDHCNGLCKAGPHVVLGGRCMAPPVPGTAYFEKVVYGQGAVANPFAAKPPPAKDKEK